MTEKWMITSTNLVSGPKAWSHITNPGGLRDTSYLHQWGPRLPVPSKHTYLPRNRPALWIAWFTAFRLFSSSVWLLQRILYWFIKSLLRSYSSTYRVFMFFLGEQSVQLFASQGTRKSFLACQYKGVVIHGCDGYQGYLHVCQLQDNRLV